MASHDGDEGALARRLEDLEVRIAYFEHSLATLDSVVCHANEELARVREIVGALQRDAAQQDGEVRRGGLDDEIPPHY